MSRAFQVASEAFQARRAGRRASRASRRERTLHGVRQYEVQAHFRRFPGPPQPSWIVVKATAASDGTVRAQVLERVGATREQDLWSDNLDDPRLFLRKHIVAMFGQDGKRDPNIHFLKAW